MGMFLKIICIMNIITLIVFSVDKIASINKTSRVSEEVLLILSIIGGAIGGSIGMLLFHHKTNKKRFTKIVPIAALIYLLIITYIIFKINYLS